MNPTEPNTELAPTEPVLVTVDQSQLIQIIEQRDQFYSDICKVVAALPILAAELPNIKWMKLISHLGMNPMNLFSKKKAITAEQLQALLTDLVTDHPKLREPLRDIMTFWLTYNEINHGSTTEQQ